MEYTRAMAPSTTGSTDEVDHKTTQTYSDFYWNYKITQDAVALMRKHGHAVKVVNEATGEIVVE
jgi:salicylate hydroxylase